MSAEALNDHSVYGNLVFEAASARGIPGARGGRVRRVVSGFREKGLRDCESTRSNKINTLQRDGRDRAE